MARRNTPTGVGKTPNCLITRVLGQKHPHRRGEDLRCLCGYRKVVETPPQAWGRLAGRLAELKFGRNTPTGVGKTSKQARTMAVITGNTPTGVGKTDHFANASRLPQKHPHRRGEDNARVETAATSKETPPQAWGRLTGSLSSVTNSGNTPTGVGKTTLRWSSSWAAGKHPHRRGEDPAACRCSGRWSETPPQAWGRRLIRAHQTMATGNTPTGVGKTVSVIRPVNYGQKHPHRRGEDGNGNPCRPVPAETPPQAWGRRTARPGRWSRPGNTPTGVGKTLSPSRRRIIT